MVSSSALDKTFGTWSIHIGHMSLAFKTVAPKLFNAKKINNRRFHNGLIKFYGFLGSIGQLHDSFTLRLHG